ncbi:MAG: 1-deoxy-D-xylulose-5-phosphate reductoisomerase [Gammaproteobacteria bacterium]|nr:1-deoxy-D-xylulose-5-phosphate reductoisomerase [Gammaproteobacteria bacterium]
MAQDKNTTGVAILGSTGSIGRSTLDVIARNPDRFKVVALSAHQSIDLLLQQVIQFKPQYVVVTDAAAAATFKVQLKDIADSPQLLSAENGLVEVVQLDAVDSVMAAIVGGAGLPSTLAAADAGKNVLLANKEALVMAGELLLTAAAESGARLLPIDSEHNAVLQCLANQSVSQPMLGVEHITLTASGGPFLKTPLEQLASVTPEQACAHPNWDMGRKISVDSATMMNKGLEVIEACFLFDLSPNQVKVLIHPQSLVHAMVSYCDGSVLAHLGHPDMCVPIAHALGWPERITSGVAPLSLADCANLEFYEPDAERFPCLTLALDAQRAGQAATIALNAANEIAVSAFLKSAIVYQDIYKVVATIVEQEEAIKIQTIEDVFRVDARARREAERLVTNWT